MRLEFLEKVLPRKEIGSKEFLDFVLFLNNKKEKGQNWEWSTYRVGLICYPNIFTEYTGLTLWHFKSSFVESVFLG